ncbi:PQQ-binding-like beta-propeller repeat protein [Rhodococcus hoagii]|nr:PQQ-binding-like beta-propeller repeat protein [Prescottella equi]
MTAANRVVLVGPDGTIRAVNADNGATIWASQPVADVGETHPVVGHSADRAFAAVKAGTTIAVVPMNGSGTHVEPFTVPSTLTSQLSSQGEGVMVVDGNLPPAVLDADGTLRPIAIPPGHAVYEVLSDGAAVAAPAEGGWSILPPSGTPAAVTPAVPADAVAAPHPATSARGVVSAWWNTADPTQRVISFHDARSGAVIASAKVPAHTVEAGLPTVVSEDRTLLSAGPVLVNASNEATYIEGWLPSNASAGSVFGTLGDQRAVWSTATGKVTVMAEGAAVPWFVSDGGLAIVLDQRGDQMRLAAIRPRST